MHNNQYMLNKSIKVIVADEFIDTISTSLNMCELNLLLVEQYP